ncbi:hypothetical protein C8J57DRAFT_1513378 [Mycena rebaudengoi]|nr:hypothetical protein C8J57DRAFT_1513378 [Mycena rebaudengoi]
MFISPGFVCQPEQLDTQISISNAMRSICDEIPVNGYIVIGFDSEWNVDVVPHGRLSGQGPPAIAQVTYKDRVYVLQIGEMLSHKALPVEPDNLLPSSQVIKAGCQWRLARLYVAADAAATAAREENDAGGAAGITVRVCAGMRVVALRVCCGAGVAVAVANGGVPGDPDRDNGGDVPALPNDPVKPALSMRLPASAVP